MAQNVRQLAGDSTHTYVLLPQAFSAASCGLRTRPSTLTRVEETRRRVCLPCVVSMLKWRQQSKTVNARRRVSIVCCSARRSPAAARSLLTLPPNPGFEEGGKRAAFALPPQADMAAAKCALMERCMCVCHTRSAGNHTRGQAPQ